MSVGVRVMIAFSPCQFRVGRIVPSRPFASELHTSSHCCSRTKDGDALIPKLGEQRKDKWSRQLQTSRSSECSATFFLSIPVYTIDYTMIFTNMIGSSDVVK